MWDKEDIINTLEFAALKSYTIFRRRAPPLPNSINLDFHKTSTITDWHFKLVPNVLKTPLGYWFVLYGSVNGTIIKSSLVVDVVDNVAKTENSFYRLSGSMSLRCDPHKLFDEKTLAKFDEGFPHDWRSVLENEIARIESLGNQPLKLDTLQKPVKKRAKDETKAQNASVVAPASRATESPLFKRLLSAEKKLLDKKVAEILSSESPEPEHNSPIEKEFKENVDARQNKTDKDEEVVVGPRRRRTVKNFVLKVQAKDPRDVTKGSPKAKNAIGDVVIKEKTSVTPVRAERVEKAETDLAENAEPAESEALVVERTREKAHSIGVVVEKRKRGRPRKIVPPVVEEKMPTPVKKRRRRLTMPASLKPEKD